MATRKRESSGPPESEPDSSDARPQTLRSATAGREFASALRSDIANTFIRLRRSWTPLRANVARRFIRSRPRTTCAGATVHVLRRFAIAAALLAVAGLLAMLSASGAMLWALQGTPLERPVSAVDRPALLLEAANGDPLGRVGPFKVPEAVHKEFPSHLVSAVLSIEDRRFYHHIGIDPIGMVRALRRNVAAGEIVEGGSTITQQLVKNRFVGNDRTYSRKLREAVMAILLELRLSKEEILTRYLNSVYLGSGAHGMASAARLYFDKRLSDLTLAESAMLAGLIKAPSHYNPLQNLKLAHERATVVIDAMLENGVISPGAARHAKTHPAALKPAREASQASSWFTDWAARKASEITGSFPHTVRVRTTVMPQLQLAAERVVTQALATEGKRLGASQAALVALRPDGAVLAMVGGRDYAESQFNRAIEANRQPGSAFKLFVYLAALRNGYTPDDTIDASAIQIKKWQPENFGGKEYGRMTLADSFVRSINTAAVRLALDVGIEQVIAAARDLGVDAPLPTVPSLALGVAEVSLLDLTGAYASVRAGRKVEPWGIAAIGNAASSELRKVGPLLQSSHGIAPYHRPMTEMLRQVVDRGTGHRASLDVFAAGKTGTSQNHRDAWFIGFTDSLIVGVWIGNDDGTATKGVVGGALPASIWQKFVIEAHDIIKGPGSYAIASAANEAITSTASVPPEEISTSPVADAPCDIQACTASYRSFRSSDCTYQPYDGPRQVCTRSEPPTPSKFAEWKPDSRDDATNATHVDGNVVRIHRDGKVVKYTVPREARAHMRCNVDACARHYRSFDPSDCTYQPFTGGPRRLCTR